MGLVKCADCGENFYTNWGWFANHSCDEIRLARELQEEQNDLRLHREREAKEAQKKAAEELERQNKQKITDRLNDLITKQHDIEFNVKLHTDLCSNIVHISEYNISEIENIIESIIREKDMVDVGVLNKLNWIFTTKLIWRFYDCSFKQKGIQPKRDDIIFKSDKSLDSSIFRINPYTSSIFSTSSDIYYTCGKLSSHIAVLKLIKEYPLFLYVPISINEIIVNYALIIAYFEDPSNLENKKIWMRENDIKVKSSTDLALEQSKLHIEQLTKDLAEAYIELEQSELLLENMTKDLAEVNDLSEKIQQLVKVNKHAQASRKRTIELIST